MHRWLWTGLHIDCPIGFTPQKPRIEHLNLLLAVHTNRPITPNLGSKSSAFNYAPSSQDHHPPKTMGTHNPPIKFASVSPQKHNAPINQGSLHCFPSSIPWYIYNYIYISIVGCVSHRYPMMYPWDSPLAGTQWRLKQLNNQAPEWNEACYPWWPSPRRRCLGWWPLLRPWPWNAASPVGKDRLEIGPWKFYNKHALEMEIFTIHN